MNEVYEPSDYKGRYERWKANAENNLISEYITDSEKLGVGYPRLLANISRLNRIATLLKNRFGIKDLSKVKESQLKDLFYEMGSGKIIKDDGGIYEAVGDYIKRFKSFWHWHMKAEHRKGNDIFDITTDFKEKKQQPKFVYFTSQQLERMMNESDYDLKILMHFLFDTGIRSPKELMNVRVCDFYNNFKEVNIREESAKTFGRRIKLMYCSDNVRKYIQDNKLSGEQQVFPINPVSVNKKLKRIGSKVLGQEITLGRLPGNNLTLYDFRHSSVCHWLPIYKSESALKFRFGWKRSEEIYYYSQLLGMRDTITQDDLMVEGATKSEMEREITELRKSRETQDNKLNSMTDNMQQLTIQLKNVFEEMQSLKIKKVHHINAHR